MRPADVNCIEAMRGEMHAELNAVRGEMKEEAGALRSEIQAMGSDMDMRFDTTSGFIALLAALIVTQL